MILITFGLACLFAFGHLEAVGLSGHLGSFGRYSYIEAHRGIGPGRGHFSYVSRRGNFGGGTGFNWYYGGSDLGYLAPQVSYFDPVTAQETAYPPQMVISAPEYVPDEPAEETIPSRPRITVIGEEMKRGPLPRIIYGTAGVE
jgi:hypothetical protein